MPPQSLTVISDERILWDFSTQWINTGGAETKTKKQPFVADAKCRVPTMQNRLGDLIPLFSKKSCYHQGFFAVKRREVFILGAMWIALVRGWRRDCVVSGMETRFQ